MLLMKGQHLTILKCDWIQKRGPIQQHSLRKC